MIKVKTISISLGTTIFIGILLGGAAALLSSSLTFNAQSTLAAVNVELYSDAECTQALTDMSWGIVYPEGVYNQLVYVKNPELSQKSYI